MLWRLFFTLLVACLLVLCFGSMASADPFQFVHEDTGAFISYAEVILDDVFYGFTDMYGRINLNAARGKHKCELVFLGKDLTKTLLIRGNKKLKVEKF